MKNVLLFTALLLTVSAANAQKQPNIQTASIKAPATVKIDGKPTEWGAMQAYNHATDLAYTLANDEDNLYLIIQTADPSIIIRAVNGRVTLTINKVDKKSEKDAVAISYPVFEKNEKAVMSVQDKLSTPKIADSIMQLNNKRLNTKVKMIKVTGVAGLDTLISIYNENGIKAKSAFDDKMLYTCEMAVPLKLLGLSVKDAAKFAYNVRLNGVIYDDVPGISITRNASGEITSMDIHKDQMIPNAGNMTAPTDFWGAYTLVR